MKRKTKIKEQFAPPKKIKMTLSDFFEHELPAVVDVVTFCNSMPISLYAGTTVVKSPEVVFRGLVFSQDRLISEEYLLNFRRTEADLGVVIGTNNYSLPMAAGALAKRDLDENEDDLIELPPFHNERAPIGPVIRSRRSVRRYSGKCISLNNVSTVLAHSGGVSGHLQISNVTETVSFGMSSRIDLRAAASGGGLYPIDLFILALNVEQLAPGVYRYLPKQHALKAIKSSAPLPALRRLAQFAEIEVEKAGFLIGYIYNVFENARKYGEGALSFAFLETGAIAAHIHLLCTALGLGSCDVGSFSKRHFERLFDADGISRHMIHLTVVGTAGKE
jgi:SagB-type dehydrogenase family enzyme